jgi:hypothetical protein
MKIAGTEVDFATVAKICGCKEKNSRKVTYSFTDSYHSLCIDKRAADKSDKNIVEREIIELKMMLDLRP